MPIDVCPPALTQWEKGAHLSLNCLILHLILQKETKLIVRLFSIVVVILLDAVCSLCLL
jgi:hypothetical protein